MIAAEGAIALGWQTWISPVWLVANREVTPFWSYFRVEGQNEAAGAAAATALAFD